MANFDVGKILRHEWTEEGFLKCYMRIGRVGELEYVNPEDGSRITQVVERDVLFAKDSIDTLKAKPITDEHPPKPVDSSNASLYARGLSSPYVVIDGDFLGVISTITDKDLIEDIVSGRKQECSAGYYTDLEDLPNGKKRQKYRKYNHIAICAKGRAGRDVKVQMDDANWVLDSVDIDTETEPSIQFDTFLSENDKNKKPNNMKFKLNGFQFDTEDESLVEAATAVNKELETLRGLADSSKLNTDSLEATKSELETQVSTLKTENENLTVKLQDAESKLINLDSQSASVTAETVKFWVDVLPKLKEFNTDFEPDYAMPKVEVKRLLLKQMYPQMNFDGKSEDYLQGFYENASVNTQKAVEKTAEEEGEEEVEELNTDSSPLTDALTNLYKGRQLEASGINESINSYVQNLESAWRSN